MMRKRLLSILLSVCMVITLLPTMTVTAGAAESWCGSGTSEEPYLIENVAGLQALAASVNDGTTYSGSYFKLTANLDLSSVANWTPIGTSGNTFQGAFDGNFHTIYNLTIHTSSRYCGLFGRVKNATIKNLGVENANVVSTSNDAAVLVGNAEAGGTISRCYVTGSVSASGGNGGILASTHGSSNATTIENCYARITLINTGSTADISGISGWNYSNSVIIQNCFSACVGETRPVAGWSDGSPVNIEKITNTFYDNTLSPSLSSGHTSLGKSTSQLQLKDTFTGWDFTSIWAIDSAKNGGYPYLRGFNPGLGGAPGSVSVTVKDSENVSVTNATVVIKPSGDTDNGTTLSHESNGVYSGTVTTTGKTYDVYVNGTKVGTVTQTGSAAATGTVTVSDGGAPSPTTYTVTFDANGRGTAPDALTDVASGAFITAPSVPTADGHTVSGWYREAECTNEWHFNTDTVTANVTLYAKWVPVSSSGELALLNNGYPYGKDMGSSQITLVMDAENGTTYQWQVADTKDGGYADIDGATAASYPFAPTSGKWYRCVVNGTVESKAVQVVKPGSDNRTWTKPYDYGSNYYITNGTIAYMVNGTIFDVAGLYVKDTTSYMLSTSYNRYWQTYSSTAAAPDAGSYSSGYASLDALRVAFSEDDACAVLFEADLAADHQAFSFGCDTQLGNSTTSGSYSDYAALIAKIKDGALEQISMMGAASETSVEADTPAFVIAPDSTTPASRFWVGRYSSRKTYAYNIKTSADDTTTLISDQNVVTRVEDTDSGMTMSWLNVTSGGSVKFKFAVGSVQDTGAVDASEVSGTVTTNTRDVAVDVKLMQGNKTIKALQNITLTGSESTYTGSFAISPVFPGTYNLVITQGVKTVTALIAVVNEDVELEIAIPSAVINSKLNVIGDADVVVGGLDDEAQAVKENSSATSVTITMTVESKAENDAANADAIKIAAPGKTLQYLDIKLQKTLDGTTTDLPEPANLLTIVIPFTKGTKQNIAVYRYHGSAAEMLTANPAPGNEGFVVGDTAVTIYAKKFSTYAIGYTEAGSDPTPPATESSGGGSVTYTITGADTANGKLTISRRTASKGTTVTVTVTPDEGYVLASLTVKDKNGNKIDLTEKGGKYTFTMPASHVTVATAFVKAVCPRDDTCPVSGFTDASANAWYHDGVHYCVENGLMKGTTSTTFRPNGTTTRAMVAVMLWRMAGSPVVNYAMRFEDVGQNDWCAEAVRWAAAEGVMGGYGDGRFGPNDFITREQLVAVLWRYARYKGVDVRIGEETSLLAYDDAADVAGYAVSAMQWATGAGVVHGVTNTTLAPKRNATRAQIAAIFQRYCENAAK